MATRWLVIADRGWTLSNVDFATGDTFTMIPGCTQTSVPDARKRVHDVHDIAVTRAGALARRLT